MYKPVKKSFGGWYSNLSEKAEKFPIILISKGWKITNVEKFAKEVAREGYIVVVIELKNQMKRGYYTNDCLQENLFHKIYLEYLRDFFELSEIPIGLLG